MPVGSSEILECVGKLHEGIADPDSWTSGLDGLCNLVGNSLLLLGVVDRERRNFEDIIGHRMLPESFALVRGPLANEIDNPWLAMLPNQPLRRPLTLDHLIRQEDLERTRLWTDLYLPFDVSASAGAVLERQPEAAEIVTIARLGPEPEFRTVELETFARLIPHLARAWRVKRTLADWQSRAGALESVLDRLDRAVIVTGAEGQVRFANRAADRLLSRGDGIGARGGRLRAARPRQTDVLLSLIERAAHTGVGAACVAVDAIALPRDDEVCPLAVVAEPLAPPHGEALGQSSCPGSILFIGDSETSTRPSIERLRTVYGLTPAEARLTALVVSGESVASAAEELGVSQNTAKYHLKSVFGKVGVGRQSQLVRRVLADVGGLAEPEKLQPSS